MVVRKYADARDKLDTLEAIFQMAEQFSKKMLEADSFDCSNTFRVPSTINEISEADVNEVTQAHWNNTGTIITNMVASMETNRIIRKVKRTLTRNHGKTRIKSHETKITSPSMVIRSPSPKMLASQLLKM